MIESNILGAAVGIQNQGVIDKSEGTALPSTVNGVIAGKFKRGRMDKAFKVTSANYRSLLGHDPSNPSYQAVEDVFNSGVSDISVRRVGAPGKSQPSDGSGSGDGDGPPLFFCIPTNLDVLYKEGYNEPTGELYGRYRVDGGAWVNYTAPASYYLADDFLRHTGVMQSQGGGGISPFQFKISNRGGYLSGASAQRPYAGGQDAVVEVKRTTVDFELTDGGTNDLVQLLFGGSISVSSCAIGQWYGV